MSLIPRRYAAGVLALLVAAALPACTGTTASPPSPPGSTVVAANARTERVVDGDTLVVRIRNRRETVRLIGIDTPETVDQNRPVQCYGHEASAHTAQLVPPGTALRLVLDAEARDRYGRLLAYVYRATDGLFVNLDLAAGGYAAPLAIAPNTAFSAQVDAAVSAARAQGAGLWGTCGGPGLPLDAAAGASRSASAGG